MTNTPTDPLDEILDDLRYAAEIDYPGEYGMPIVPDEDIANAKAKLLALIHTREQQAQEISVLQILEMYDKANMPQIISVPDVDYDGMLTIPDGTRYKTTYQLLKDIKDRCLATLNKEDK